MTDLRGPDEFKASDERRGKERQIRTAIALARLINLREERLLKTSWTFHVFVAVCTLNIPEYQDLPSSRRLSPARRLCPRSSPNGRLLGIVMTKNSFLARSVATLARNFLPISLPKGPQTHSPRLSIGIYHHNGRKDTCFPSMSTNFYR